jgi:hypothetical protein
MTKVYNISANNVIKELKGFSFIDMFGHLYDLPARREAMFREVEHHCSDILEAQLFNDLISHEEDTDVPTTMILSTSKLEQVLSQVFNVHSQFWEQYYNRQQYAKGMHHSTLLDEGSSDEWLPLARTRYPAFFVTADALWHASGERMKHHELIMQSLQCLLKGYLYKAYGQVDPFTKEIASALKLIGPVNAPMYRNFLEQCL